MNNKAIGYKDAVKKLKELERVQREHKRILRISTSALRGMYQMRINADKDNINLLLSLISAHKQARYYYGVIKEVQDALGLNSKERVLVDGALDEKK